MGQFFRENARTGFFCERSMLPVAAACSAPCHLARRSRWTWSA